MTMLEKIIDELTEPALSLAGPLLKTKVLASRIGNEELLNWVDRELSGYRGKNKSEIPDYRKARPVLTCTILEGGSMFQNEPLPLLLINEEFRKGLLDHKLDDSIQTLEQQAAGTYGDVIGKEYGSDMCAILTKQLISNPRHIQFINLKIAIHISEITQALSLIRSRLLDFMLKLESEVPNLDELIKEKITFKEEVNQKINQLIQQTIIYAGDNNTLITGNQNQVQQS
jgi:hypothetical protein